MDDFGVPQETSILSLWVVTLGYLISSTESYWIYWSRVDRSHLAKPTGEVFHTYWWLVGGLNPSEKYWSIGMILPNIWENKTDVPNHQPDDICAWTQTHVFTLPLVGMCDSSRSDIKKELWIVCNHGINIQDTRVFFTCGFIPYRGPQSKITFLSGVSPWILNFHKLSYHHVLVVEPPLWKIWVRQLG